MRGIIETDTFEENEVSLLSLLAVLAAGKWIILRSCAAAAIVAAAIAFLIPVEFSAEAVILPPQAPQTSASALLSQASGLSALGALSGLSVRSTTDLYLYMGILRDRTIADALIARFHLKEFYGDKTLLETRKHLARHTNINTNKDPLIHIKVEARDPKLAADLANAYVEELFGQNSVLALTEASQRRLFFERQLVKEKDELASAEVAMRNTQQSTRLITPEGQAETLIRSVAQLRAAIAERQAQLESVKTFAAETNPEYTRLQEEVKSLNSQLQKLESNRQAGGGLDVSAASLPQASLEYVRKLRDLKYHETLFEALSRQYEAARLDEAKAAPVIQVVDRAVTPEKKSWPPRTLLVLSAVLLTVVGCCCWLLTRNSWVEPARR
jgi:capsule polysaccharide export protein KpsE/RkpR